MSSSSSQSHGQIAGDIRFQVSGGMEDESLHDSLGRAQPEQHDGEEEMNFKEDQDEEDSDNKDEEDDSNKSSSSDGQNGWYTTLNDIAIDQNSLRDASIHKRKRGDEYLTSIDFLHKFLTPEILESIATYTNEFIKKAHIHTDSVEIQAFIAVHLYMSIHREPRQEMYWHLDNHHPFVINLFSRNRFLILAHYLSVVPLAEAKNKLDPIGCIRSFQTIVNVRFKDNAPNRDKIALDEAGAAFLGNHPFKQYIPRKPHPHCFKIWCLCVGKYLAHFETYEGKSKEKHKKGATHAVVMKMVEGYENKHNTLFIDSLFTSIDAAKDLQAMGIRVCGSINRLRKGLPSLDKKTLKGFKQGEYLQYQNGDLTLAVFHDRVTTLTLYNHCLNSDMSSLSRWNNKNERVEIPCPKAVWDYFNYARYDDILNQLHYSYLLGRKSKRTCSRLIWWMLDMCIINAFELWSFEHVDETHLNFRIDLMNRLAKPLQEIKQAEVATQIRASGVCAPDASAFDHYYDRLDTKANCKMCWVHDQKRVQTTFGCPTCGIHLCMGACFRRYHPKH